MGTSTPVLDGFLEDLQRARSKLESGAPCRNACVHASTGTEGGEAQKQQVESIGAFLLSKQRLVEKARCDTSQGTSEDGNEPMRIVDHVIQHSDTVQGIILKYGCSLRDIKRLNHMTSDRITSYTVLRVPVRSGADDRKGACEGDKEASAAVQKIRRDRVLDALQTALPDLEKKEATFYLKDADWSLTKALQQYQEDLDWEQANPFTQSEDTKLSLSRTKSRKEKARGFSLLRAFRRWKKSPRISHTSKNSQKGSLEMPLLSKRADTSFAAPPQE